LAAVASQIGLDDFAAAFGRIISLCGDQHQGVAGCCGELFKAHARQLVVNLFGSAGNASAGSTRTVMAVFIARLLFTKSRR
jgi:hypothetical protein